MNIPESLSGFISFQLKGSVFPKQKVSDCSVRAIKIKIILYLKECLSFSVLLQDVEQLVLSQ